MAKNNEPTTATKRDKAVVIVKVLALAIMGLAALKLTGLLMVGDMITAALGYGLAVVTVYFALSIVK